MAHGGAPGEVGSEACTCTHIFILPGVDQFHQSLDDPLFIEPLEGKGGCDGSAHI